MAERQAKSTPAKWRPILGPWPTVARIPAKLLMAIHRYQAQIAHVCPLPALRSCVTGFFDADMTTSLSGTCRA